ncbi:Ku protein [Pseudoroseomonas wenyumeiae]
MSERPIWRGTLRLALVSCRIALVNAHHERNNLHFHLINPKTGNRIRTQTVDAETGKEVERGDLARGYEYEKGEYVILTEEDFDSARVESSSTLNIAKFVPASSVGPLYVDNSYYVVPDDDDSADVYAVLREALQESGMMALSRLVLFRRERAVGIVPLGKGLVLHTLHEESDLRPAKSAFEDVPKSAPDKEMVKLARQLIERQEDEFDPSDTEDRYEARLREVIEARKEGKPAEPEPEEQPDRGNVIDLMAALLNSLKQGEPRKAPASKPAPSKAAPKKAAPARKKRA